MKVQFKVYRYNPEVDKKPYYQDYTVTVENEGTKVLTAIELIKQQDPTLAVRRSCREGVCGSDGMSINGKNRLACITSIGELSQPIKLQPLPGLPVIRDLIVNMDQFYKNYEKVKPYLIPVEGDNPVKERLQSPEDRAKLDGLYECILCACCTTSCPSFWWNPDKFIGPSGLLQAYRFVIDSRDGATKERLEALQDPFSVFRCRTIMNCVSVCPKGLNPTKAIGKLRSMMLKNSL
ncbi:succinate dehydrogenase iron-sulfur subunit [Fastidiosibacter lacustris]|uniref:succinate dehydrogenase iron-sulfur subunit n=1 Tax=Fastidiosibacter lacustris TaxID=2056695 RepID=UPI000E344545|nr:succinate dehydrogenase iron-sulfur subunit [Fastidiosibacter lacustris]